MPNLSRSEPRPGKATPSLRDYIAAYVLWFLTSAISLLVALAIRDLIQMAMVLTTWDRYAVHAINQFSTIALILVLVAVVAGVEGYYRHGVTKGQLRYRFWRVATVLCVVFAATFGLRLVLEAIASFVNLITVLLFALAAGATWGARWAARRAAPRRSSTAAVTTASTTSRLGWLVLPALFVIGAVLLFLPIKYPLNPYDEGLALVNGLRVLHGDVPFRDYWAIYPPGQSYILAALFQLAGPTVMVERVYDTLVRIALVIVIYFVSAKLLPYPRWAIVPFLGAVILLAAATFYGYAVFPALLFSFLAVLFCYRYLETQRRVWLLAAGLSTGVTLIFRIDLGVYTGLAIAAGLTISALWIKRKPGGVGRRLTTLVVTWLLVAAGAVAVAVPFYGYLVAVAGVGALWNNLITFPATTFHAVRHLPYPALSPDWSRWAEGDDLLFNLERVFADWLGFYLPIVVFAATATVVVVAVVRHRKDESRLTRRHAEAMVLTVLGVGLFVQALSRYDGIHVLPASLCVVILLVWLMQQIPLTLWRKPLFAVPAGVLLAIPVLLYFLLPYIQLSEVVHQFPPGDCYSELPAASCVPSMLPNQEEAVRLLEQRDPGGGAALVALTRHDRIFANDISFYFLAGRPIPTRYHELHPGVATTRPVQEEIVEELKRGDVRWLMLVDWPNPSEPNGSAVSSGVTVLDDYIGDNYQRDRSVGWYQLWRHKE